jgi:ankyrin repeat protein
VDTNEVSPLQLAKLAISKGADLNPRILKRAPRRVVYFGAPVEPVPEGATPIWRASRTFDVEFVTFLLAAGADPAIGSSEGRTPLMAAAGPDFGSYTGDKFTEIGTEERAIQVARLLLAAGVEINAANNRGETALHAASLRGAQQLVKFLVEHGARLDVKDIYNRTALDVALGAPRPGPYGPTYTVPPVHEDVAAFLREAMIAKGMTIEPYVPPVPRQVPSVQ